MAPNNAWRQSSPRESPCGRAPCEPLARRNSSRPSASTAATQSVAECAFPRGTVGTRKGVHSESARMNESWRDLRVGDRIRIIRLPTEWNQRGYRVPPCTRRLYTRLIQRRRPVRVYKIDDWGLPWIACRFRRKNGSWDHHFLAVNDDSWVMVRNRQHRLPAARGRLRRRSSRPSSGGA
jgi:hypothetical protein